MWNVFFIEILEYSHDKDPLKLYIVCISLRGKVGMRQPELGVNLSVLSVSQLQLAYTDIYYKVSLLTVVYSHVIEHKIVPFTHSLGREMSRSCHCTHYLIFQSSRLTFAATATVLVGAAVTIENDSFWKVAVTAK